MKPIMVLAAIFALSGCATIKPTTKDIECAPDASCFVCTGSVAKDDASLEVKLKYCPNQEPKAEGTP